MRKILSGLMVMGLAGMIGCEQGTPGGVGTTDEQPTYGQAENTFNLSVPRLSSSIKQGEVMETQVGIKRAKNFDQDVTLKFSDLPEGVTVDPETTQIKSSEKEAKITFKTSDETPLGDYKINIVGQPTEGADAQVDFELTIVAKDSFTLSMPDASPIKQGTEQTLTIGIDRDDDFNQDVSLSFGDLPMGVTLEPESPVIKNGEAGAQVKMTVAENASLGDFTIPVTGSPTDGVKNSDKIELTVVAK